MASAKRTPRVSRISRGQTVAYARKQRSTTDGGEDGTKEPASDAPPESAGDTPATSDAAATSDAPAAPSASSDADASSTAPAADPSAPVAPAEAASSGEPPAPSAAVTAAPPDATPPEQPVEPVQTRVTTDRMAAGAALGAPPAMPAVSAPPAAGAAEDPTRMPGPREIPDGHPDDPAAPPGRVPPGDSRSLRRRVDRHEFALVYRIQTHVISRVGVVGTRGQWRVVEYPTPSMASHAYAKECSRFVSDGFSDYRE